jgi:hypothetical protein
MEYNCILPMMAGAPVGTTNNHYLLTRVFL